MKEKSQVMTVNPEDLMGSPEGDSREYQKPELITPPSEVKSEVNCRT